MTATTVPVMSREMRREWLGHLACADFTGISQRARFALLATVSPHLAPDPDALRRAWDAYEWAVKVHQDLETDGSYWAIYWPGLTCDDRAGEARSLAAELLAEAENVLLGGAGQ